jgi:hypothetical protein
VPRNSRQSPLMRAIGTGYSPPARHGLFLHHMDRPEALPGCPSDEQAFDGRPAYLRGRGRGAAADVRDILSLVARLRAPPSPA